MILVNGWIIANKSRYNNFIRFKKDSVNTFVWYSSSSTNSIDGSIDEKTHYIRIGAADGGEHKIYFFNKETLMESFELLEEIMWKYDYTKNKTIVKD